jgi:hypothetical protein
VTLKSQTASKMLAKTWVGTLPYMSPERVKVMTLFLNDMGCIHSVVPNETGVKWAAFLMKRLLTTVTDSGSLMHIANTPVVVYWSARCPT